MSFLKKHQLIHIERSPTNSKSCPSDLWMISSERNEGSGRNEGGKWRTRPESQCFPSSLSLSHSVINPNLILRLCFTFSRCCEKKSCGNRNETPSDPVVIDR